MNIFVYSDESGVFDVVHNRFFVYAGVIYLSSEERENAARRYKAAENNIRTRNNLSPEDEAKATAIDNTSKHKLFKLQRNTHKFGAVIRQNAVNMNIFKDKRTKQRYLDFAFKIALKRKLEQLINRGVINPSEVKNIKVHVDQHSTATNGRYELEEALDREFRQGTFNFSYNLFYPPIFPSMNKVSVHFLDSRKVPLIRAADIVANRLYYYADKALDVSKLESDMFNIIWLP